LPGHLLLESSTDLRKGEEIGGGGSAKIFEGVLVNPTLREKNKQFADSIAIKEFQIKENDVQQDVAASFLQEVAVLRFYFASSPPHLSPFPLF